MRLFAVILSAVLLYGTIALADTGGGDLNDACKAALGRKDLDAAFANCPRQRDGGPISDENYAKMRC